MTGDSKYTVTVCIVNGPHCDNDSQTCIFYEYAMGGFCNLLQKDLEEGDSGKAIKDNKCPGKKG